MDGAKATRAFTDSPGTWPSAGTRTPATASALACATTTWRRPSSRPSCMDWSKVVPASTYPDFLLAELAIDAAVGGAAFILTFPVVARRRPS